MPVEDILALAKEGRIRVPHFQRALRWQSSHVLDLFDSIYRGMPIGVLLFAQQECGADLCRFGPVEVDAKPAHDCLLVIDGQQRITSLVAAMLHPDANPRTGTFAVWFDLESEQFVRLRHHEPPLSWIPLNVVADSTRLMQWLMASTLRSERHDLLDRALALNKTIREYLVPAYVVQDAGEDALKLIFKRINSSGVSMKASEVFHALQGGTEYTQADACRSLARMGFGAVSEDLFVRCLQAVEDIDPRHEIPETHAEDSALRMRRTEAALRATLHFLMADAGICHAQLLPYKLPILVLARLFHLYPSPQPRNRRRLAWWVWRGALSREHAASNHAEVRAYHALMNDDESGTVTRILHRVGRRDPVIDLSATGVSRGAQVRLVALAMLAAKPYNPDTGGNWTAEEAQAWLGTERTLGALLRDVAGRTEAPLAGRIIATGRLQAQRVVEQGDSQALATHGISLAARAAYLANELPEFDRIRNADLAPRLTAYLRLRAGLDENDRPPIADLVRETEGVADRG